MHSCAIIESSQVNQDSHFEKYGFSSLDDFLVFKMEKKLVNSHFKKIVVANCLIITNFLAFLQQFIL